MECKEFRIGINSKSLAFKAKAMLGEIVEGRSRTTTSKEGLRDFNKLSKLSTDSILLIRESEPMKENLSTVFSKVASEI